MRSRGFIRRIQATLLIGLLVTLFGDVRPYLEADTTPTAHAASYDTLPLAFEPNHGQAAEGVQYVVHHGRSITAFTKDGATTSIGTGAVTMSLVGANEQYYAGQDKLESKTNYFIGNDPTKWQSDIPNYQSLLAKEVYPGIDLTYYGTNSQLEHDFIVAPGADYKQIAFTLTGQDSLYLDDNGNLVLQLGEEVLILQAPKTYQERPGSIQTIPSSFVLTNDTVRFELHGNYDPTLPLIIDPVLIYSTYLGGSGSDRGDGIFIDPSGYRYLVGQTTSTNFPTSSPYQAGNAGGVDSFVTKFDPAGSTLLFSTYIGGGGTEGVLDVHVDASSNVYIVGITTSTNYPTASAYQATFAGGVQDGFLTKIASLGTSLLFSTYIGGTGSEVLNAVKVFSDNTVYIAGSTDSTDYPTSAAYQGSNAGSFDGFLTKFTAAGTGLVFSTYLGGSGSDSIGSVGLALDAVGNIFLSGSTGSANFPTTSAYQASYGGGGSDGFVAKLNASASSLIYSTYLGGSGDDSSANLAIDSGGHAIVTSFSTSTNYPTAAAYQASSGGGQDAVVTKVGTTGATLVFSTYLGGSGSEAGRTVAVDSADNIIVGGSTTSSNFPTSSAYQANSGGGTDGYVTKFNSSGSSLIFSTYLGGSGSDASDTIDLTLDLSGVVFVTGNTTSTNFPILNAFQSSSGGSSDAFLVQLSEHTVIVSGMINPTLTFTVNSTSCALGTLSTTETKFCTHTMSAATNGQSGYTISYLPAATLTSGGDTIDAMATQTSSALASEQFGFNLRANTAIGSNTASNFGADPSGGSGTAMSGYNLVDQFKFATAGENIAQSTVASLTTIFTVGVVANIASSTDAGSYATTLTYNIVAGY